jgi:hypothetical protein
VEKQLFKIVLGYVSGTVVANLYIDGSSTSHWTNENTIYCNSTTVNCNNTTYAVNGQVIYDGRVNFDMYSDTWGSTFSLELEGVGEVHVPITFEFVMGSVR